MKLKLILTVLLWCCIIFCKAQTLQKSIATPYIGLGACSINQTDAFSFTSNQAALASLKNSAAGVYGERRFMLSEFNNYTAVFVIPTSSGNFGLKAGYNGFSDYNQTNFGLAYGRSLGKKIDAGVQFNYTALSVAGYGNASAISFEAGTILHLTDQLHAGIHVSNPVGGKFGKNGQEKLSSVYTFGLGYDASDKFFICAAIEKEEDQPVTIHAGLQYRIIPQLLARIGLSTATTTWWMGLGVPIKTFRIDITASYHPQLGITPGLLVLFNFKKG